MTNFERIKGYYKEFDEWSRLDTPAGKLELKIVLDLIQAYVEPNSEIFDLGGGAGRYSFELAQLGYKMHLADLSPALISIAKKKLSAKSIHEKILSIEVANALDLSHKKDEEFENVLLFGPLYHLTQKSEIKRCIQEVSRILKPKGKIIASYIPYHCGLVSILERSFYSPNQVDPQAFKKVFEEGVFNNQSKSGFQEGSYLRTTDLVDIMTAHGFSNILSRSIRGIGYKQEEDMLNLERTRPEFFHKIMDILNQSSTDQEIIETCGHAIFIGEKA